ncbi:hypothetical protein FJZ31_24605 [Candidatus Poribacteria bacterium]|nr:hypothetical protein [Candidatus Poribacteria bacterium]
MSRKLALLIGNSEYEDTNLARLRTPDADVNALAEVLRDVEIGGFDEVTPLINQPNDLIRRAIGRFFAGKTREDLLLLYFAGHGVKDDQGNLYLAIKDTERDLLRATAIPAVFITQEMDNSLSRRQVLILDCCHSGAFARGARGAPGASVGTAAAFEGNGFGKVVLTAADTTQYAWEGDEVSGQAENSVFTRYLIQGLRTGAADKNADGRITIDELYEYVHERVVNETPKQTPGKWTYKQQGEIVIAQNPHPVVEPVELPRELQQAIENPLAAVREGAVRELDRLLRGSDKGLALAAQESLKGLTEDDSKRVSNAATEILAAYAEAQGIKDEQADTEQKVDVISVAPEQGEELKQTELKIVEQDEEQVVEKKEGRNPKDGAEMIYIPEGEFIMGTSDEQIDILLRQFPDRKRSLVDDEKPQHRVYLDGYWIYKYEVTVAQYRKFCQETKRQMPEEPSWGWQAEHPIVNVTWNDAVAYCQWAGVELPTEAQWEKAARGTGGRIWPWGNKWDANKCNNSQTGPQKTTPVGNYPQGASPYGVMDMVGNVSEWCADWYDENYYQNSPARNPQGPSSGKWRVLRGGSWLLNPDHLRVAYRYWFLPAYRSSVIGFRCTSPRFPC